MGDFVDNTLGTNWFGGNSNDKAAAAQAESVAKANQVLNTGLQNQTEYLNPWNEGGLSAFQQLVGGNIGANYQQSPGYQAQLAAGQNAINNGMAARGLGNSGAALKALTSYSQDQANQDYQQYYNNEMNRLSGLAGMGQNAANSLANASGTWAANTSNNLTGLGNAQASAEIGKGNQQAAFVGTLAQGLATKFSDERLKKNIKPVDKDELAELRKELRAFYYEYKDVLHGEVGRHLGIMAQDLEKTKLGKWIVVENSEGHKVIDMHKVLSLFLATLSEEAA